MVHCLRGGPVLAGGTNISESNGPGGPIISGDPFLGDRYTACLCIHVQICGDVFNSEGFCNLHNGQYAGDGCLRQLQRSNMLSNCLRHLRSQGNQYIIRSA